MTLAIFHIRAREMNIAQSGCVCLSVILAEGSSSLEPIDDGPKVRTTT